MEEIIKEFKKKAKYIYKTLAFIMMFPNERKKNIPRIVKAIQDIEELLKHIKDKLNLYMKVTKAESHFNQASDEFELKKEEQINTVDFFDEILKGPYPMPSSYDIVLILVTEGKMTMKQGLEWLRRFENARREKQEQ